MDRRRALLLASCAGLSLAASAQAETPSDANDVSELVVTASTTRQLGRAATSSEGEVTRQELDLRPVYRVGQLLETIPGLVVTAHSGEGKANQYLVRGFNLDHGTDLASFVEGMPVNMRTHGHGQGYTDLNFMIPELAAGIRFAKGPYRAADGDFGAVASYRIDYRDTLPPEASVSVGDMGDRRVFVGGSVETASGHWLAAAERVGLDGPWTHPDDLRKTNLVARWSAANGDSRSSLTAMYYRGLWNATTDQPQRAVIQGLIDRFGTLDPTDAGQAERFSLSARRETATPWGRLSLNAYAVRAQMTLWNNFTHLLDDPVNGDQHGQNDRRTYVGGAAVLAHDTDLGFARGVTSLGVETRMDDIYVDRRHTKARRTLSLDNADKVRESSQAVFAESALTWTPWLRATAGLRLDRIEAHDHDRLTDARLSRSQTLLQPKVSLVLGPWAKTEIYASAGAGFHSNDARGALKDDGPLLVKATSREIGVRTAIAPHLDLAVTAFDMRFSSELTYDADAGATESGPASRRTGIEASAQYRPKSWIELNANLALAHSRYRGVPAGEAHIPDAPRSVASFGAIVDNLGRVFGGLEFRRLGPHALTEDNSQRSRGYAEWNADIGYHLTDKTKVQLNVFNLLNSKDNAAEYYYADRLAGEPADGVEDLHVHPLEPRSWRVTLTRSF